MCSCSVETTPRVVVDKLSAGDIEQVNLQVPIYMMHLIDVPRC